MSNSLDDEELNFSKGNDSGKNNLESVDPYFSREVEMLEVDDNHPGCRFALRFEQMYETKYLADVKIACQREVFLAHSVILVSQSQYFDRLWNQPGVNPTREKTCAVEGDPRILDLILRYIYTGTLSALITSTGDIETMARELGIDHLVARCTRERFKNIPATVENCLEMWKVGFETSSTALVAKSKPVALAEFQQLQDCDEVAELPYGCVSEYLSHPHLVVLSPDERLSCVLDWLHHDTTRSQQLIPLLNLLPLHDMSRVFLKHILKKDSLVKDNPRAQTVIKAAMKLVAEVGVGGPAPVAKEAFITVTGMVQYVGGKWKGASTKVLAFPDSLSASTRKLAAFPSLAAQQGGFASCGHLSLLYVSGVGPQREEIWKMDLVDKNWVSIGKLCRSRWRHCMAVVNENVYVVGGCSPETDDPVMSIEVHSVSVEGVGGEVGKIEGKICTIALCQVVGESDLLIGGVTNGSGTLLLQVYSIRTHRVTSSVQWPSFDHNVCGMVVAGNDVIVCARDATYVVDIDSVKQGDSTAVKVLSSQYVVPKRACGVVLAEHGQSVFLLGGVARSLKGKGDVYMYKAPVRDIVSDSGSGWIPVNNPNWPVGKSIVYSSCCSKVTLPPDATS